MVREPSAGSGARAMKADGLLTAPCFHEGLPGTRELLA